MTAGAAQDEDKDHAINTSKQATGGLPSHQTRFDPEINRYEPYKPLQTPRDTVNH